MKSAERHFFTVAILLACAWAVVFSVMGIKKYESTFSHDWRDEAVNNQMMFNTARGNIFYSTVKGEHRHHRHFRPMFIVASAPYLLIRDARAWYILVAVVCALGGLAAFRLGRNLIGGGPGGLLACALWLAWPALHEITLGNMDVETFAATLWLFAAAYYVESRYTGFIVFSILALCCKETQAPILAAFGIIALIQRRPVKWWAVPVAAGTAWFVIALKVIIPFYHPTFDTIYNRFIGAEGYAFPISFFVALAQNPGETFAAVFSRQNLSLLGRTIRGLGFMPIFSPLQLLGSGSIITQILLLKDPLPVRQAHMLAAILPFSFWAAVEGARRLGDWALYIPFIGKDKGVFTRRTFMVLMIGASVFTVSDVGLFGKNQNYGHEPFDSIEASNVLASEFLAPTDAEKRAALAIKQIPANAVVTANSRLLLLLSSRAALFEYGTQKHPSELAGADYIVLWLLKAECRTCTFTYLGSENLELAADLVRDGRFVVAVADPAFAILAVKGRDISAWETAEGAREAFVERVVELAGRLRRGEGLPADEPR
jgi:uncharacterized membrane protein